MMIPNARYLFCIVTSMLFIVGSSARTHPDLCNRVCGGIEIPFPFGIDGNDCYLNPWYEVVCNSSVPFLSRINREVVNISLQNGVLLIKDYVSSSGCSRSRQGPGNSQPLNISGQGSPFFLTDTNHLVAVGCNTRAVMTDIQPQIIGCETSCVLIGLALLFFVMGVFGLYRFLKNQKRIYQSKMFFRRNGGLLLKQQLARKEGTVEMSKIFTSKELEKATDNFNKNRILGQGGQGTVYKGMLVDGRIVAVKRSKVVDEDKVEEFINEVVVLSQINHRNIVKLLGCCLETKVPILVYEFVPNGDLFKLLHGESDDYKMTWEVRLHIAIEIAGALSYLHLAASFPIYHRDIKTTNILLDEKHQAKVSDFGTSRSLTTDQTHLTTQVAGTFGYVDPEYFQTNKFTDKSDVYSFGVVLVELLTGEKPSTRVRSEEKTRGFAAHFVEAVKEKRVLDIVDDRIKDECDLDQVMLMAKLATGCLNRKGKKRPNMREVSIELEKIRSSTYDSEIHIEEDDDDEEDQAMSFNIDGPWDVVMTAPASLFDNASPTSDVQPLVPQRTL
ncbi:hypothetical protein YC2023_057816 [Brassica napus]